MPSGKTWEESLSDGYTYIPPLPGLLIAGNDYARIEPLIANGVVKADTVVFDAGVTPDSLTVGSDGVTLRIRTGQGKGADIQLAQASDPIGTGIERFQFADGTTLTMSQMLALAAPSTSTATNGNDLMYGTNGNDCIDALGGNDTVYGGAGEDTILGGAGDDRLYVDGEYSVLDGGDGNDILQSGSASNDLYGGAGNDTLNGAGGDDWLDGGAGNDSLDGGDGADTYRLRAGDGDDVVYDGKESSSIDTISFDASVALADIRVTRDTSSLYLDERRDRRSDHPHRLLRPGPQCVCGAFCRRHTMVGAGPGVAHRDTQSRAHRCDAARPTRRRRRARRSASPFPARRSPIRMRATRSSTAR